MDSHSEHEQIPTDLPKVSTRTVAVVAIVVVACFAGLFALGWFPRQNRIARTQEDAEQVMQLISAASGSHLSLYPAGTAAAANSAASAIW